MKIFTKFRKVERSVENFKKFWVKCELDTKILEKFWEHTWFKENHGALLVKIYFAQTLNFSPAAISGIFVHVAEYSKYQEKLFKGVHCYISVDYGSPVQIL